MTRAVVSGLGPNGMLAVLKLLNEGFDVTAVDARESYGRAIHLSIRQSYLDAVGELDPVLLRSLTPALSPIREIQHIGGARIQAHSRAPSSMSDGGSRQNIRERMQEPPVMHVRLDQLERCFFARLDELTKTRPLSIMRGTSFQVDGDDDGPISCRARGVDLGAPELIVVAEGGKSATARALHRTSVALSRHALYISVHVDDVLGPITRRLDTTVPVDDGTRASVSYWATGHGDRRLGTWLVFEIPDAIHAGRPSKTFDRGYFERAAMDVLELEKPPTPSSLPFSGTFRFEQQLTPLPVAGTNTVFLGDAAGMGHHALSTGLELGACDLSALDARIRGGSQDAYRDVVVRSRIDMLAFGMHEYHSRLVVDPTAWIVDALAQTAVSAKDYIAVEVARSLAP